MSRIADTRRPEPDQPSSAYRWAGYALGFSIGGFFDGILLHQVLQWHHLLSGLQGGRFDDIRFQILADGLFHALMYIIAGVGLWLLWRTRMEFSRSGASRLVLGNALIGFGAWHLIDGVVSHWVLGIHRIRMDSEVPLVWDLVWFTAFGVAFVVWGWTVKRRNSGSSSPGAAATSATLAIIAVTTAALTLLAPGRNADAMTVVMFLPGTTPAQAMAAVSSAGGRLVWSDPSDQVWAIDMPEGSSSSGLYRNGAMLVSDAFLPLGCIDWVSRPSR